MNEPQKRIICKIPQAWIDKEKAVRSRVLEEREGFAGSALLVEALLSSRTPRVQTTESLLHEALRGIGIDAKVSILREKNGTKIFSVEFAAGGEAKNIAIPLNDKILGYDNPLDTVREIITALGITPQPRLEKRFFYIVPGLDKRG